MAPLTTNYSLNSQNHTVSNPMMRAGFLTSSYLSLTLIILTNANPLPQAPARTPFLSTVSQPDATIIPTDLAIPITDPSASSAIIAATRPTTTPITIKTHSVGSPTLHPGVGNTSPYPVSNATNHSHSNITGGHLYNGTPHGNGKKCNNSGELHITYTSGNETYNATIYPNEPLRCVTQTHKGTYPSRTRGLPLPIGTGDSDPMTQGGDDHGLQGEAGAGTDGITDGMKLPPVDSDGDRNGD